MSANCQDSYVAWLTVFVFCLQSTLSQYCIEGWHNSLVSIWPVIIVSTCDRSKPVQFQLSMKFLSRLRASIWILYTVSTIPVLCPRLAYLLCRYFASNDNQYCTSSKPVESQLSIRFICRLIDSIWILFTASTKLIPNQTLTMGAVLFPYCRIQAWYWQSVRAQY